MALDDDIPQSNVLATLNDSDQTGEATNALILNQVFGKFLDSSNSSSADVITAIGAIATAIANSLIGGTTGVTDTALLRAKGTGGFALENSVVLCDGSGNLSGVGSIDGVILATASPTKTLTVNFTLTLAGTDGTTMTFPSTNGTIAALNIADQTLSGGANVTSNNLGTKSSGTLTIDCGTCPLQYVINGGAFTLAAPSNDGSCILLTTNNGSAGSITFSGFSVGTSTGDTLTTTNTSKFMISIIRINGTSTYRVAACQ